MLKVVRRFIPFILILLCNMSMAEDISREQFMGLDEQVQAIKTDVLDISTELKLLEEKLLYPSSTEVSIFVSLADEGFRLDSVDIELDGKLVTHYIYSFKELEALHSGGMQRIYTGNIAAGEHLLKVNVAGKGSSGDDYRRSESYTFDKDIRPALVEITLTGPGVGSRTIEFNNW